MLLSASRISYQISADGLLPKVLRKFDSEKDVAVNGIILSTAVSAIGLFSGNIFIIAAISNFGLLLLCDILPGSRALPQDGQGRKG